MNQFFFWRLSDQINKYAWRDISGRKSTSYLEHKWMNITVGEIIWYFGIMMRISIDPNNMGGGPSYFVEDPMIHLCHGYPVQLRGYDSWEIYVMTLTRLKIYAVTFTLRLEHLSVETNFIGCFILSICAMINKKYYLLLVIMVLLIREKFLWGAGTALYV